MRTLRVLIIEKNVDDAGLLVENLRTAGYDPVCQRVETVKEMRNALEAGAWDVILSDHAVPGLSGLEALEIVQESGRDIPFLIVSANIDGATAASLMRHGVNDYLLKGDLTRLVPAIKREMH